MDGHYYIVLAFTDNIEMYPHRKGMEHIPSFLSNYTLDVDKGVTGVQGNVYDAVKFIDKDDAKMFIDKTKKHFSEWELEIVDISKRIFGKSKHRFVYPPTQ